MFVSLTRILTHPGGSHKDELLACSLLAAVHRVPIERREPTEADLADPTVAVVDVGGQHDPSLHNFDHHQFSADHPPVCALSLVLQHLGVYDDARQFCDWLEPAEWFDTRGPHTTAKWLGIQRDVLSRLSSPIDITILRRFAQAQLLQPGEPLWEVLAYIGQDLLDYLRDLRSRLDFIAQNAEIWSQPGWDHEVLFLPRTEPLPDDPSAGIGRYLESIGKSHTVAALIYPDRRGAGYGLTRHNDSPLYDFTRISTQPDVHFAHARGFVAKTSASDIPRLRELLSQSVV